jgi:hypothetical protein
MNLGRRSFAALVLATLAFGAWLASREVQFRPVTPVVLPAFQDAPRGGDVALAVAPPPRAGNVSARTLQLSVPARMVAAPAVLAAEGLLSSDGSAFVEHHGLRVQVLREERALRRLEALGRGEADVALVGLDEWVRAGSPGDVLALAAWSRGADGVRARDGAASLEALSGRKVGVVGGRGEWLWWALLSRGAYSPETRRKLEQAVVMQPDAASGEAALASGAVEALVGPLPARPGERTVASTAQVPGALAEVLVARPGLLASAPGDVTALLEGWWEGLQLLEVDPAGAVSQAAAALGISGEEARVGLARVRLAGFGDNALFFGLTGGEAPADVLARSVLEALARGGVRPPGPPVPPSRGRGVVASLAPKWRGLRTADSWVLRGKLRVDRHPLVGQRVLLHFEPGGTGLLDGDRRLLESVGEAMQRLQTPTLLMEAEGVLAPAQLPSLPDRRARWVQSELQRGFRLSTDRFSQLGEAPPGALPGGEAADVLSLTLQAR